MEYKTNGLMQIDGTVTKTSLIPNGAIDYSLWNGLILMEIIVGRKKYWKLNAAGLEIQKF
jgi:hypothetical protein